MDLLMELIVVVLTLHFSSKSFNVYFITVLTLFVIKYNIDANSLLDNGSDILEKFCIKSFLTFSNNNLFFGLN